GGSTGCRCIRASAAGRASPWSCPSSVPGCARRDTPSRRMSLDLGRRRALREELAEGTAHGDVYVRRLRRAHVGSSLLALTAFGGLVGALPLVLYLVPTLQHSTIAGVPVAIWLVVIPPFPLFVLIGWLHQRRADALDAAFRELVEGGRE